MKATETFKPKTGCDIIRLDHSGIMVFHLIGTLLFSAVVETAISLSQIFICVCAEEFLALLTLFLHIF